MHMMPLTPPRLTFFCTCVAQSRMMASAGAKPRRRRRLLVGGAAILTWLSAIAPVSGVPCPKLCSGHGRCDTGNRQCVCYDGWYGPDCTMARCPKGHAWADVATGTDDAHNMAECSNRGLCDTTLGSCECEEGFEGQACERKTCPNQCNGHGRCQSMSYYASLKNPGVGPVYKYKQVWDADLLYGCNCDSGYFGPDCSLKHCPTGDDPFTGTSIDPKTQQYNEKQQVVCVATDGSFTLSFRGETTAPIPADASAAKVKAALQALSTISDSYYDAVAVTFVGNKIKACNIEGTRIQIEFLQDFGPLPMLLADGSRLIHSYSQLTPSLQVTRIVIGTKENEWCSNRGLCDVSTGVCNCMTNYDTSNGYAASGQRGDCGYAVVSITNCPGEIACSGHGVCNGYPTYRCECSNGWAGADCSEMTCPFGRSWYSLPTATDVAHLEKTECSDMGVCDRTYGVCNCMEGYEGAACERLKCPGEPVCSDHGTCMTMALLAQQNKVNGVASPKTYGSIPNDPAVWDFDKMQGCLCDDGFWGYDCSQRVCPTGDDPMTSPQYDEMQDLYCEDNGDGFLKLTFREATTTTIAASATVATLQAALEALPTVRKVSILNLGTTDSVCTLTGQTLRITFLVAHGDLPLLEVSSSYIDPAPTVEEFLAGTKEDIECSGRGLCDYGTGLCECFTGYGSSNGMGGPGTYGDCGYADPIIAPEFVEDAASEVTTQL